MADETYKIDRSFHSGCMTRSVQWLFQKGPSFPPSPFAFHVGPSCGFKCASPVHVMVACVGH